MIGEREAAQRALDKALACLENELRREQHVSEVESRLTEMGRTNHFAELMEQALTSRRSRRG